MNTYTNDSTKCTCASGYFFNTSGASVTQVLNQSCSYVACPANTYANTSGVAYATATTACTYQKCTGSHVAAYGNNGNCACASDYAYNAGYATTTQTASESCNYLKCGANSSNDPDDPGTCICDEGWYYQNPAGGELQASYTAINSTCYVRQDSVTGTSADFDTPGAHTFTAASSGTYKVELWGAQGGDAAYGGKGAYVSGVITMQKNETYYLYVGGNGYNSFGYNGGGFAVRSQTYNGGGGTDIRYFATSPSSSDLEWNSANGLNSRIMVASGGSGRATEISGGRNVGANAGGLVGYDGNHYWYNCDGHDNRMITPATGGTQVSSGKKMVCDGGACMHTNPYDGYFGIGAVDATERSGFYSAGGGGGGYYGGCGGGGGGLFAKS